MAASASVGCFARWPVSASASCSSAPSSTTFQIIPQSAARSASKVSPSMASARARASPISRGRKKLAPESGTSPIFTNAWMNFALRAASTISQASA